MCNYPDTSRCPDEQLITSIASLLVAVETNISCYASLLTALLQAMQKQAAHRVATAVEYLSWLCMTENLGHVHVLLLVQM